MTSSKPPDPERPGLVAAGARPRRAAVDRFRGLLRDAVQDPAAAAELTAGYASLPQPERRALREVVSEDAARMGLDVTQLLACWGALERDPGDARRWRAWVRGDRVVFAAPGRGAIEIGPDGKLALHDEPWSPADEHRPVELEEAVDRLAELLWTGRRSGRPLPAPLSAFADLFDR